MPEHPRKTKKKFVPIVEEGPPPSPAIHGRSASWNPANRFEKLHVDLGDEDVVQIDPTSDEEAKTRRETQARRDVREKVMARTENRKTRSTTGQRATDCCT